jgi:hypothetical protein
MDRELDERRRLARWAVDGPKDRGAGSVGTTLPEGWPATGLPVRLPIEHFAPPGSFVVDETSSYLLAGGTTSEQTMFSYAVPQAQVLRITAVGWDADDDAALSLLRWSGYAQGAPVPGMVNQVSGMSTTSYPMPYNVAIPGPCVFQIRGTNLLSLYSWTFVIRVVGYLFAPVR